MKSAKMKFFKIILWSLLIITSSCKESNEVIPKQNKINSELKKKLESILLKDQGVREIVREDISDAKKAELLLKLNLNETDIAGNKKFDLIRKIDSINLLEVENIIKNYGYPSKSIVGEPANKAVFFVIQHSNKIDKYLPLIRKAAEKGDINKTSLALMEDRYLMQKGLEQIYGTQIKGQMYKKGEWFYFLWPLKNIDSTNIWRKEAGFEQSVEEYLKDKNVEFKLYEISELTEL